MVIETMSLRPCAKAEVRRNRYKMAVDAEEGRRRREDNMVEIRKSKREESLLKKRRELVQQQQQFSVPFQASPLEKKVDFLIFIIFCAFSFLPLSVVHVKLFIFICPDKD